MICYVCDNEMVFQEKYFTDLLGHVKIYKCLVCNEVIYQPYKREEKEKNNNVHINI